MLHDQRNSLYKALRVRASTLLRNIPEYTFNKIHATRFRRISEEQMLPSDVINFFLFLHKQYTPTRQDESSGRPLAIHHVDVRFVIFSKQDIRV